jgi:hypothetical protein
MGLEFLILCNNGVEVDVDKNLILYIFMPVLPC